MNAACRLPRFEHRGLLGRGGTAEVSRVFAREFNRDIALKYALATQANPDFDFAELARREFHLVGRQRLPFVVSLYGLSTDAPEYIMMELCSGPPLDQIGRVESIPVALNLISAVAAGLELLRSRRLIHGDFKPQNVFLPRDWSDRVESDLFFPKLSDFSLGRHEDESEDIRAGLGTVGYLAPETITQRLTSHRSDLFALGVTAYQMLTGRHPFLQNDCDPVKVNSRTLEENPEALEKLRPDTPPEVIDIINRLLAKSPENRPGSAWEVCESLARAGARYPYRRALHPRWFVQPDRDYADNLTHIDRTDVQLARRLDALTDRRSDRLRQILTGNFVRHNLSYDGSRFVFAGAPYWPCAMRRRAMAVYAGAPVGRRRLMIKAATAGCLETARRIDSRTEELRGDVSRPLLEVLVQLLRPATVRRLSSRWAPVIEGEELYREATKLYLQAGNLEGAERCAHQAAVTLQKGNENEAAMSLLSQVIRFAGTLGLDFEVRQLLMIRGDLQKSMGDTESAEATYVRIIDLYQDRSPDSLLGETYKDLGDLYRIKQNVSKGLQALARARDIYQRLGDELELSRTINNAGNLYWIEGNLAHALKCYRQAFHTQRRLNALVETASTLSNIGSIYTLTGRLSRAVLIFEQSLRLKKELGHAGEIARTLNNLGYTYYRSGKLNKAADVLRESLGLNERIGAKKEVLFNLDNLASVMIAAGQLRQSLEYLKTGLSLTTELHDRPHEASFNINAAIVLSTLR